MNFVDSLYNKYEADFQKCLDKILSPFYKNGFKANFYTINCLDKNYCRLFSITYSIVSNENKNTNTVNMDVRYICQIDDSGNIEHIFKIANPERIYHNRSLRWPGAYSMNKKLFTNRGFDYYYDYTFKEDLDKWVTTRGDEILKYIKKSITKMEQVNEYNLKNLSISNNIYSIQKDSVISMVEEINEKLPKGFKLKLIDESIEDLQDKFKYQIIGTNNPNQNHAYLYIDNCGDDIIEDENNPLPMYSYEYNNTGYYSDRYKITLLYNKDKKSWSFSIETPLKDYMLESIFELKSEGNLNTLDTLRDDLILFFKKDNILYKRIKKDIEDIKNVKKF